MNNNPIHVMLKNFVSLWLQKPTSFLFCLANSPSIKLELLCYHLMSNFKSLETSSCFKGFKGLFHGAFRLANGGCLLPREYLYIVSTWAKFFVQNTTRIQYCRHTHKRGNNTLLYIVYVFSNTFNFVSSSVRNFDNFSGKNLRVSNFW